MLAVEHVGRRSVAVRVLAALHRPVLVDRQPAETAIDVYQLESAVLLSTQSLRLHRTHVQQPLSRLLRDLEDFHQQHTPQKDRYIVVGSVDHLLRLRNVVLFVIGAA